MDEYLSRLILLTLRTVGGGPGQYKRKYLVVVVVRVDTGLLARELAWHVVFIYSFIHSLSQTAACWLVDLGFLFQLVLLKS